MKSHYDPITDMFIAVCNPVLTNTNRTALIEMDPHCFFTVHSLNLKLIDFSKKWPHILMAANNETDEADLTAFHEDRFKNLSLYEMISPSSLEIVAKRHKDCNCLKFFSIKKIFSRKSLNLFKFLKI
jgi:hypothetical protein